MAETETESVNLPVLGMTCASCQHHVEEALRATAGVESARVDLMGHRATVVFDPEKAAPEALVEAIRGAGYDAVLPRAGEEGAEREDTSVAESARKAWVTLVAGAVAMVLAMPLGGEMGAVGRVQMHLLPWLYAADPNLLRWTLLAMTTVVAAWAGRGIYLSAIRALRHGSTNMNTLVSLGTAVAYVYSAFATVRPAASRSTYFDAVLLILGFLLLGKALEARAKRRALEA
ncbi:MAG TPA: cation transporter, partial [Terracidiphilus sp.]